MFDRENTGTVDIHSFGKLFEYANQWLNIFKTYDRNQSGQIDAQELNQGESSTTPPFVHFMYFLLLKSIVAFHLQLSHKWASTFRHNSRSS